MQTLTVSFFGHRRVERFDAVERQLDAIVGDLIRENAFVEFLVGRDGDFDQLATAAVRRAKRNMFAGNSCLIWVQAYPSAAYARDADAFDTYYDLVELCDASAAAYPKAAIGIRNREMVDRSDLCVFYVVRSFGGAWQALQYAKKQNKRMILLNDDEIRPAP